MVEEPTSPATPSAEIAERHVAQKSRHRSTTRCCNGPAIEVLAIQSWARLVCRIPLETHDSTSRRAIAGQSRSGSRRVALKFPTAPFSLPRSGRARGLTASAACRTPRPLAERGGVGWPSCATSSRRRHGVGHGTQASPSRLELGRAQSRRASRRACRSEVLMPRTCRRVHELERAPGRMLAETPLEEVLDRLDVVVGLALDRLDLEASARRNRPRCCPQRETPREPGTRTARVERAPAATRSRLAPGPDQEDSLNRPAAPRTGGVAARRPRSAVRGLSSCLHPE